MQEIYLQIKQGYIYSHVQIDELKRSKKVKGNKSLSTHLEISHAKDDCQGDTSYGPRTLPSS